VDGGAKTIHYNSDSVYEVSVFFTPVCGTLEPIDVYRDGPGDGVTLRDAGAPCARIGSRLSSSEFGVPAP